MARTAKCYPTDEQYERWREEAGRRGMTNSDFIASMVEAGIKADRGFSAGVKPDETADVLRKQRDEVREENEALRERISDLEDQAYWSEQRAVRGFLRDNPGATYEEILNYVQSTMHERLGRITEGLVIDERDDGLDGYWLPEQQEGDAVTDGVAPFVSRTGASVGPRGDR